MSEWINVQKDTSPLLIIHEKKMCCERHCEEAKTFCSQTYFSLNPILQELSEYSSTGCRHQNQQEEEESKTQDTADRAVMKSDDSNFKQKQIGDASQDLSQDQNYTTALNPGHVKCNLSSAAALALV